MSSGKRCTKMMQLCITLVAVCCTMLLPHLAAAQIKAINAWPAAPPIVSNGTAGTVSGKVVPQAGQGRVMLVAVACEYAAAPGTQTLTVNFGGQAATQIVTNITNKNTIWLGYVNEAKLTAATNNVLTVTNSNTTGLAGMYVTSAVYAGVDQTTPTTGSASASTASAASLTLTAFNVSGKTGNAGMAVTVSNWDGRTSTISAGYTEQADYAGTNFNVASSFKPITAAGTEAPVSTAASAAAGAFAGVGLNPDLKISTITTCGGCHGYGPLDGSARNTPDGQFTGSHNKHAGSAETQYDYACTKCHYNNTTNNHSTGFKNISGSAVAGSSYSQGKKIAITSTPVFGTCNRSTCHSTGRATIQYSPSPTWGGSSAGCLSCHAGRNGATGAIAKSSAGFSLSTSHFQHLKYGASDINCQTCHGKTATDAATLKNYTAVSYHVNGTADVIFTNIAYASYTSYKRGTKTCSNTACHGGTTRNAWSNNGALNNDNTCVHCHGVAGTSAASTDKKRFAPGWGNTGISTDGRNVASDYRVGAHFVHLSSVYMKQLKCNECHVVPTTPFQGTHMAVPRYNSQSLTFGQASSANKNSTSPAKTDGTASTPATCSVTYCHGGNMPSGDTGGSARSVNWNQNTLMSGTPGADCGTCHGNPPTTGTTAGTHSGKAATTSCANCHGPVVNSTGAIINKNLHLNGTLETLMACNSCHDYDTTGGGTLWGSSSYGIEGLGAHAKHIEYLKVRMGGISLNAATDSYGSGNAAAICGVCHSNNGATDHTTTTPSNPRNINFGGSTARGFNGTPTYNGLSGTSSSVNPKSCSNVDCHYGTSAIWSTY